MKKLIDWWQAFKDRFKALDKETIHCFVRTVDGHQVLVEKDWAITKDDDYSIIVTIAMQQGIKARWTVSYELGYRMESEFRVLRDNRRALYNFIKNMKRENGLP